MCDPLPYHIGYNTVDYIDPTTLGDRSRCSRSFVPTHGSIRLEPSSASHRRRLDVFVEECWSNICYDRFSQREADVVCKQLGYPSGLSRGIVSDRLHP